MDEHYANDHGNVVALASGGSGTCSVEGDGKRKRTLVDEDILPEIEVMPEIEAMPISVTKKTRHV